jgi:hypothetical protein
MIGYQADIISWKKGALYDEQRRWDFLGTPLCKNPDYNPKSGTHILSVVKVAYPHLAEWNTNIGQHRAFLLTALTRMHK